MRGALRILSIAEAGGARLRPERRRGQQNIVAQIPFKDRTKGRKIMDESGRSTGIYVSTYEEYTDLAEDADGTIKGIYDDTIVLIDEYHNLLTQYLEPRSRQYCPQYTKLKEKLRESRNSVIVGMTATPIVGDPSDAERLLDVLRPIPQEGDEIVYEYEGTE